MAVVVGKAARRDIPVEVEALGRVTPIASVGIKARLESMVVEVHFADGAHVKQGDPLFTLDSRSIEAQIRQADGALARSRAQLEGAERDLRRFKALVAKNAAPATSLDNAVTQVEIFRAAIQTDEANLEHLRIQLGYTTIRSPISGRIGTALAKVGNFVRPADLVPMATIIQVAPIYLTFPVDQRHLSGIRSAIEKGTATVSAQVPGDSNKRAEGRVALIENTVDMATGTVAVRAAMPNEDELLWPGALANVRMTLRSDEAVTVPTVAVQAGQKGTFVYVVEEDRVRMQPVKVGRLTGSDSVIESGLEGRETVVIDGHLLLTDGARIEVRDPKPGA